MSFFHPIFYPLLSVPEEGEWESSWGGWLAAGQHEPTTRVHIIEPLALKNFSENKDNEVDKRERCLMLEIISELRHRNIAYFVEVHKAPAKGDSAQRSGVGGWHFRLLTTFLPISGLKNLMRSAVFLYFDQLAGTLYPKLSQETCIEFGLKTCCGISICQ